MKYEIHIYKKGVFDSVEYPSSADTFISRAKVLLNIEDYNLRDIKAVEDTLIIEVVD